MTSGTENGESFFVEPAESASFSTRRPSSLRHNFHTHPLMQLDQLELLAKKLMVKEQCRFVSPDIKQDSDFHHESRPHDGRGIEDVFRNISTSGSWVALYNVEVEPEYRGFLEEVMESCRPLWEKEQSGIFNLSGFIFISAPPSVTPFHIDRENNFWLQVRGQKSISLFDNHDYSIVDGRAVENFILYGGLNAVRLTERCAARQTEYDMRAGDGVFFPNTTPHMTRSDVDWVTEDDGVSISIGVVFYSDQTRQVARIHQGNAVLRKFGANPQPPGMHPATDRWKVPLGWLGAALKSKFFGYKAPPGAF